MADQLKTAVQRIVRGAMDRAVASGGLAAVFGALADEIAHRVTLDSMFRSPIAGMNPHEVFAGVSDSFWFWVCTEGYRRSPSVRALVPGMPDENVQLQFTGSKGDAVLGEAFAAYVIFRDAYWQHAGAIDECRAILDFGCGWGRIIRFFLKDVEPSTLWGVDPVDKMIEICKRDNKWCNFERIEPEPPTPFPDDTFDLIYSYSVFSHLSEDMHQKCLAELQRIVKPRGLVMVTTRGRDFILRCAEMRKRGRLDGYHLGPRSSASAFTSTDRALADYDRGNYCFSSLADSGNWSYWGEAAIPRDYVVRNWTGPLTFVDYIDDRARCDQNVIVMQKPPEGPPG